MKYRYAYLWRNRDLTSSARDLEQMVGMLESSAAQLRDIMATGKVVLDASRMFEDWAILYTNSPQVAGLFGFCKTSELFTVALEMAESES